MTEVPTKTEEWSWVRGSKGVAENEGVGYP
jgi:hypothetical protein